MKKLIVCFATVCFLQVEAQQPLNIVPAPVELVPGKAVILLDEKTMISAATTDEKNVASIFNQYLQSVGLKPLAIKPVNKSVKAKGNIIGFHIISNTSQKEGYQLLVKDKAISLTGNDPAGLLYGLQTLIQLLPLRQDKALSYP